jgi:lipid A 4'-phosphatase
MTGRNGGSEDGLGTAMNNRPKNGSSSPPRPTATEGGPTSGRGDPGSREMDDQPQIKGPLERKVGLSFPAFLLIAFIVAVVFYFFPEIDFWAQGFFYSDQEAWFLRDSILARGVEDGIQRSTPSIAIGAGAIFLLSHFTRSAWLRPMRAAALMIFLCIAIGAGLLANVTFKDNWGRARPHSVVEFGGINTYTPPFIISDQCPRNCSFVAGHPSVIFAFFGVALLFTGRRRVALIVLVAALGAVVGAARMMQGSHFVSDVIFSGVLLYITAWCLHRVVTRFNLARDIRR